MLSGHSGPVWALASTYSYIVSGSSDGTVKVWSQKNLACKATFQAHSDIVHAVAARGTFFFFFFFFFKSFIETPQATWSSAVLPTNS